MCAERAVDRHDRANCGIERTRNYPSVRRVSTGFWEDIVRQCAAGRMVAAGLHRYLRSTILRVAAKPAVVMR